MKAVPSRAIGSKTKLRNKLLARNIPDIRRNVAGSRSLGIKKLSAGADSRRPVERKSFLPANERNKPGPPLRPNNGLRIPPGGRPGMGHRELFRLDRRRLLRPMERALARRPIQGSFYRNRIPQDTRKPNGPYPIPVDRPRQYRDTVRQAPMMHDDPGNLQSHGPPRSTKDTLFQGPHKARSYRDEDLKKFKVDIRPSRSPDRKNQIYDRVELRKFKIDIKGEMTDDYSRGRRNESGMAYNKQELEKLKVHIHRQDLQEQDDAHARRMATLRRDVDPNNFHVPRKQDIKMFNSLENFSSPRNQKQKNLRMEIHIDRPNIENPSYDGPVRRNIDMDSFRMPRRPGKPSVTGFQIFSL